jgi:predicted porin
MNQKSLLTALALAAAGVPAWAQGSAQISGVIDVYAGQRQLSGAAKLQKADSGGLTTSRWAIEGNEDLGDGLRALYGLSSFIRADTGEAGRTPTDRYWARYAFVGLQGGWGMLRLGRVGTPTFVNAIRFSPFADSTTFGPYMQHVYTGGQSMVTPMNAPDSAADNSIAYSTPNLAGFTASATVSMGESTTAGDRVIAALHYGAGPFAIGLGTERVEAPHSLPAGVSRIDNTQAGASWDLKVVKLFGTFSTSEMTLAAGSRDLDTWQLGLTAPLGSGLLKVAQASTTKAETGLADIKRNTLALGYDHPLSKRTDLYLVAERDKVTNLAVGNTLAAGIRHRF